MMENPVLTGIVDMIRSLWENLSTTLQGIWQGIRIAASGAWELIKNVILGPVLLLIDLVKGNFTKLIEDALNVWRNIRRAESVVCGVLCGFGCLERAEKTGGVHGIEPETVCGGGFLGDGVRDRFCPVFIGERGA